MKKVNVFSNIGFNCDISCNTACDLYIDLIPKDKKINTRILWLIEPDFITNIRNYVIENWNQFDVIFTWDQKVLDLCPNSKLFPISASWVLNYEFLQNKQFCVTTLVGGKRLSHNHLIRQMLPEVEKFITNIKIDIFNSKNNPYYKLKNYREISEPVKKNEMFYSQYHIAIENISELNYFTEKLIDCFQTKTIPIYIGCPNIDKFFDSRGILHARNLDEIVYFCNSLNETTYYSKLEYVEKNYELSKKYTEYRDRITHEIKNFINNI